MLYEVITHQFAEAIDLVGAQGLVEVRVELRARLADHVGSYNFV